LEVLRIIEQAENLLKTQDGEKVSLAKTLGFSHRYIADIKAGKSKNPSSDFILALINKLNFNPLWLETGEGEMFLNQEQESHPIMETTTYLTDGDVSLFKFSHGKPTPVQTHDSDPNAMVMLPVFSQRAAAGAGQPPTQLAEIEAYIPIIFELLGGTHPRNCGIVRVLGDSMTDMTLYNGDLVIFDRSKIEGDGVYVISMGTDVRVKRLEYRTFEKKIVIRSENAKRYPEPEIINFEQADNMLKVHGKVISWVHRHPY